MNKIVILENNGGRLANQLWQFANIYAYCLEKNYKIENYNFFMYQEYFNIPTPRNKFVNCAFFKFFNFHRSKKLAKSSYAVFCRIVKILFKKRVRDSKEIIFLPPSSNKLTADCIKDIETAKNKTFYFCDWNFWNPVGLKKYYPEIVKFFRPNDEISNKVDSFIGELRQKHKYLVGVHARQGDYKTFAGGKYYFSFPDVRLILDDFLASQPNKADIVFVICSDGAIDKEALQGLNYVAGPGDFMSDLYSLAKTDLMINSTSTFSQWASYYGQISSIDFSREKIDWPRDILSPEFPRKLTEWEVVNGNN